MRKRIFDFCCAAALLVLLSPAFFYIAIGVWRSSLGPVLFRQKRFGLGGRAFVMLKFRSMYIEAEADHSLVRNRNDPRVTPFGRRLRATHLDELPQLINVLRGEMSMVGPRPETYEREAEILCRVPGYLRRHEVLPGITGLTQLRGRTKALTKSEWQNHLLDLYYVRRHSLCLDCIILLHTLRAAFRLQGL